MHYPKDGNLADDTPFIWTDKFRAMLGFKDINDFPNILSSWAIRLHPDDAAKTFEMFGASLKDVTYRWFKADGQVSMDEVLLL